MSVPPILFDQKNGSGIVTLNKPYSLNSLNFEMISLLKKKLLEWAEDSTIHLVLVRSTLEKAFCSGGDLKELYEKKKQGNTEFIQKFFQEEYSLNQLIFSYPKPYISLMNGITMGGGMGISVNGSYRIVTSSSVLAMPEVFIGFFPDVGASYFLNRCPGKVGLLLGLTGYHMNAADALYVGLATHYVPKENFPLLFQSLIETDIRGNPKEGLQAILDIFSADPPQISKLEENHNAIDETFEGDGVEDLIVNLRLSKNSWMKMIYDLMEKASPLSLKITYNLLKLTKKKKFEEALNLESNLAQKFFENEDVLEGIRSVVIDKDRAPTWSYKSVFDIPDSVVQGYFS